VKLPLYSQRLNLYGLGMLTCGYGAGQLHPTDWTGLPWWGSLVLGLAILAYAYALQLGERE
jgi:hypothetical protein